MIVTSLNKIEPISIVTRYDGTCAIYLRRNIKRVKVTSVMVGDVEDVDYMWTAEERRCEGNYNLEYVTAHFDELFDSAPKDLDDQEQELRQLRKAITDIQDLTSQLLEDIPAADTEDTTTGDDE